MDAAPRRPSVLTTAAVVFLIEAFLAVLAGILALSLSHSSLSPQLQSTGVQQFSRTTDVLLLVVGALDLIAGLLILRLSSAGRILGLVLAGLFVLSGLKALIDGAGTAILSIGLNVFVIYALTTTGDVFARAKRR